MFLYGLLSWTTSKEAVELVQYLYGTFMACEIAYYTYIYAKVEHTKYQLVTGHTRSAILTGRFFGAACAQLLVSFDLMNYKELNYISFGCKATLFEFFPIPKFSYLRISILVVEYRTFSFLICRRQKNSNFDNQSLISFVCLFVFFLFFSTFSSMCFVDICSSFAIGERQFVFLFKFKW